MKMRTLKEILKDDKMTEKEIRMNSFLNSIEKLIIDNQDLIENEKKAS